MAWCPGKQRRSHKSCIHCQNGKQQQKQNFHVYKTAYIVSLFMICSYSDGDKENEDQSKMRPKSAVRLDTVVSMIDAVKDEMNFFKEKVFSGHDKETKQFIFK